jgi:flagellar motor protein MotB
MKNPVQSNMTIPDFIRLVKTGEGSYLEFKRTISSPEKVAREISAFANTRGGILLIGVNDNKSVVGVESFYEEEMALEKALAIPLQSGRVTLNNGRIGISGSVLFDFNSDQLRPEGEQLLKSLVPPLEVYLGERDEMLMVSGFTDDKPIVKGPSQRFEDNQAWQNLLQPYQIMSI